MKKLMSLVVAFTLILGGVAFSVPDSASAASGFTFSKEHEEALAHLNGIREKVGVQKLELDPYLNEAAQNHANYLLNNKATGHSEDSKKSGFTGINASERAHAVGFDKYSQVSEVISYSVKGKYKESIDFLIQAPFHRTILLTYNLNKVGFGIAGDIVVINFGQVATPTPSSAVKYPYDGQTGVGTYFLGEWENPNPLEQFKLSKSGFIISYRPTSWVDSPSTKIVDSKGASVEHFTTAQGVIYLFPKQALKTNETYTVTVEYGSTKDTWSFSTGTGTTDSGTPNPEQPTKPEQPEPIDTSVGKQFTDFQTDKYWSENMLWALNKGLITGYEEKDPKTGKIIRTLKPSAALSEAQFLTILFRYSEASLTLTTPAKDTKWWASQSYVIAEKLKLPIKGSHSNRKAADAPMTRGEMAVVLASYYNIKHNNGNSMSEQDAVQFMYDAGLSNGYTDQNGNTPKTYDSYGADKILLREHVVTFMKNYDDYLQKRSSQ